MAISAFQKVLNRLFQQFTRQWGREPQTPKEWMDLQNEAVRHFNKTKGAPTEAKPSWHTGWTPKVVPGGKGIKSLLETGDVKKGVAPKTKLSTLEGKKQKLDAAISKEEWIAKKQRENKEAIERFKAKTKKKTVEDFRDEGDWDPSGMASGGLAYMLGEPNTRIEALQHAGVIADPKGLYTDPSIYSKGESEIPQNYYEGGGVGHGPWTMGQRARTPDQEQNLETPQPQVRGTPNPMHLPKGIPSAVPRSMDPQYQQQQMMQQLMAQQMSQQPRMGMAGGGMTRRAFMKLMASLGALPFVGKLATKKAAAPVVKKAAETVIERGADGIPSYAYDLIEVVKAKGTKEIIEGIAKRNPPATKYNYKGVEVTEDGLGNTSVRKEMEETKSWNDPVADDVYIEDVVDREIGFEIRKGGTGVKDEGLETQKSFEMPDEYDETTAYMQGDPEGGIDVSDITEVIEEADHLELKKIADEAVELEDLATGNIFTKTIRNKKASGGLAYMLGE